MARKTLFGNEPPSTFTTVEGPAIGCGDGTLLVGWPCRITRLFGVDEKDDSPFDLVPIMVWTSGQTALAAVMRTDGCMQTYLIDALQFDPKWERL